MDPTTIQALMGVFQQGLQILQQAQSGAPSDGGMPPGAPDDSAAPPDSGDMYQDAAGNDPMADDAEPPMPGDDGMGGGGSLHDRVSSLENHTGLKKSASTQGLKDRVTGLEEEILGTEYEGPLVERILQLEKAAGVSPQSVAPAAGPQDDSAPAEIPLDALIKSAIQMGIQEGLAAIAATQTTQQQGTEDGLPTVDLMRKSAASNHYGQRRAVPPAIKSDAALVKAAISLGWDGDDLDAPVGLGDLLLYQYHFGQGGEPLPMSMGDDEDED